MDTKIVNAIGFFNIILIPSLAYLAIGKGFVPFLAAILIIFGVHPIADAFMSRFSWKIHGGTRFSFLYRLPVYLFVPIQLFLLRHAFVSGSGDPSAVLYSGILCGVSGGIYGIAAAHELLHSRSSFERKLSKVILQIVNFSHFEIEHLWHHAHVATLKDFETARSGESIYQYWWRATVQGYAQSWKWKTKEMTMISLLQLALFVLILGIFGMKAAAIFAVQGLVTLLLLKWIDYVEHYGLTHAWDSTRVLTNWYLFNLGFHSQHHKSPTIAYQKLPTTKAEWNELPYGYSTMVLIALVPSLWFRVMNPLLPSEGSC